MKELIQQALELFEKNKIEQPSSILGAIIHSYTRNGGTMSAFIQDYEAYFDNDTLGAKLADICIFIGIEEVPNFDFTQYSPDLDITTLFELALKKTDEINLDKPFFNSFAICVSKYFEIDLGNHIRAKIYYRNFPSQIAFGEIKNAQIYKKIENERIERERVILEWEKGMYQ